MRFKIDTSTASPLELRATAAFFNVMAEGEPVTQTGWKLTEDELGRMIGEFRTALNDEPAPFDEDLAKAADKEDASGLAASFDAIPPEVIEVAKDADGEVWNKDLHSNPPKLTESGLWRKRRNVGKPAVGESAELIEEDESPNPEPATVEDASNSGQSEPETSNEADGDADSTEPTFNDEEAEAPVSDAVEEMSQEQQLFWHLIDGARSWISFKAAVLGFIKTPEFLMWHADDQQALREKVWKIATEDVGLDVQPTDDPTAFTLWMPTETDADEVARRFKLLKANSDAYKRLPDESKARMDKSVSERVAALIA